MSRTFPVGSILVAWSIVAVVSHQAAAQGTSAASISGVVTDSSGGVLSGVAVEVSSPALSEKVRSIATNERGECRIVELRPGTYTVTFARQGFAPFQRDGIELTSKFNAAVNAELRVGAVEERVTVTGGNPLIDTRNVARQTVISAALLDTVPTGKNLLSFYALTPAAVTPTNAQDVGGSKGETTARVSVHGSKHGDTKMMIDGMSFNSFEGEGSARTFYVNVLSSDSFWKVRTIPSGFRPPRGRRQGSAPSAASESTALVSDRSAISPTRSIRITTAICGSRVRPDCGDGLLDRRHAIRCRTVNGSTPRLKTTPMACCWRPLTA
jgi:hypothetical protein